MNSALFRRNVVHLQTHSQNDSMKKSVESTLACSQAIRPITNVQRKKVCVYKRELRIHFLNILTITRRRKAIKKSAEYQNFYFFIFIRGDWNSKCVWGKVRAPGCDSFICFLSLSYSLPYELEPSRLLLFRMQNWTLNSISVELFLMRLALKKCFMDFLL